MVSSSWSRVLSVLYLRSQRRLMTIPVPPATEYVPHTEKKTRVPTAALWAKLKAEFIRGDFYQLVARGGARRGVSELGGLVPWIRVGHTLLSGFRLTVVMYDFLFPRP